MLERTSHQRARTCQLAQKEQVIERMSIYKQVFINIFHHNRYELHVFIFEAPCGGRVGRLGASGGSLGALAGLLGAPEEAPGGSLGPLGGLLGGSWRPFWASRELSGACLELLRLLGSHLDSLGGHLDAIWRPKGSKMDPKLSPKSGKNRIFFSCDFLYVFVDDI